MRSPYDEEAAQKEFDELTSLDHSVLWLKAVVKQGARIFEAAAANTKIIPYNNPARMEEHFFLTACEKAQRWIAPLNLEIAEAIRFSELGEAAKNIRDEREHDDERYGLGNQFDRMVDPGEHAKRGFIGSKSGRKMRMEKAVTDGPVSIYATASVTVHSGGSIRLGGTVDVAEVVAAAEALIEPLAQKQRAHWDRRRGDLKHLYVDSHF